MSNNKIQISNKKRSLYFFVFFVYLVFIPSNMIEAQQDKDQFELGIKGGINLSAFTKEHTEALSGFTGGVFGDFYFLENIGISVGLNYEKKGGLMKNIIPAPPSFNPAIDTISFDLYVRNNYLEIPVEFKYIFKFDNEVSLIPCIGYTYSFPTWKQEDSEKKHRQQVHDNYNFNYTGQYSDDMAVINSFSSVSIGLEASYMQFLLDLKYNIALNNIGGASNINNLDYKIHSIKILVGYRFL